MSESFNPSASSQIDEIRPDDLAASVAAMAKIGACWSLTFSPDGTWLAFVSNLNGTPQVWTVAAEGGWPELVTALDYPNPGSG